MHRNIVALIDTVTQMTARVLLNLSIFCWLQSTKTKAVFEGIFDTFVRWIDCNIWNFKSLTI